MEIQFLLMHKAGLHLLKVKINLKLYGKELVASKNSKLKKKEEKKRKEEEEKKEIALKGWGKRTSENCGETRMNSVGI